MPSRLARLVGFGVVLGATAGFGDASALRASSGEAFGSRWSADIEGELIGFEVGNDRVYAVVHDGSTLEVVAFDLADGNILWRQIVGDVEEPSRYAGGAVDNGFLLSFEESVPSAGVVMEDVAIDVAVPASSAPGPDVEPDSTSAATEGGDGPDSHLILLDGVSGEIRWDEPLYDPATYVSGQVNDHVAVVGVYDSGPAFVDLDTAESVLMQNSPDSYWLLVGEELAQFENGSLELGLDPFDPATLPTPVPLPSGTDSVTASEDGRLIVATVGSDVVGIVDGEEVWTWTPDVEDFGAVLLVDGFVGVWELVGGSFGRRLFAEIGDSGVVPLDTFPGEFTLEDISFTTDGTPALVGIIDETPDMHSRDERVRAAIVELRTGTPIRKIADDLNGMGTTGAFGAYVYTASVIDGQINVYNADTLEQVGKIPFNDDDDVRPQNLQVADTEIVVYDPKQSTISVYG